MAKSIFERLKNAVSDMNDNSKFMNVRKHILDHVGQKEEMQNCILTLHLKLEKFRVKVSYDVFYSMNGDVYKQTVNMKYDLFEECGMAKYIEDALRENDHVFDVKFTFEDLQQLYDELEIESVDSVKYNEIANKCKDRFDMIRLTDRVFYTRVDYLMSNGIVQTILFGKVLDIPLTEYSKLYPLKTCMYKPY